MPREPSGNFVFGSAAYFPYTQRSKNWINPPSPGSRFAPAVAACSDAAAANPAVSVRKKEWNTWNLCTMAFPNDDHAFAQHFVRDCRALYLAGLRTLGAPLFCKLAARGSSRPVFLALFRRRGSGRHTFLPRRISAPEARFGSGINPRKDLPASHQGFAPPATQDWPPRSRSDSSSVTAHFNLIQFSGICVNTKRTPSGEGARKLLLIAPDSCYVLPDCRSCFSADRPNA